jgi:hypothetical protein
VVIAPLRYLDHAILTTRFNQQFSRYSIIPVMDRDLIPGLR